MFFKVNVTIVFIHATYNYTKLYTLCRNYLYNVFYTCKKKHRRYTFWSYPAGLTIADPPGLEYLDKQSSFMSGPRKIRSRGSWSHIVSKATDE